jgi:dolichol-phosphate mannosyltransferase
MKELSVVIPVMDEEDNIELMIVGITNALKDIDHEIIFVDDGSKDRTLDLLKKHASESLITVEFAKNYGQSSAMQAGIDIASGKYITTLDGDLQNDPIDIPRNAKTSERQGCRPRSRGTSKS